MTTPDIVCLVRNFRIILLLSVIFFMAVEMTTLLMVISIHKLRFLQSWFPLTSVYGNIIEKYSTLCGEELIVSFILAFTQ